MAVTSSSIWAYATILCALFVLKVGASFVNITYVHSFVVKGAVCLDGSPPAYHLSPGFDSGANNWLVHLEGGGWCNNVSSCLSRKNSRLGSSKQMAKRIAFSGILSNVQFYNPDFYSWNKVKIRYCDGSSFTGDVDRVNPATKLHYRGARIWVAVMKELLANGMDRAKNALLSGCSAGGLASILHCDNFRALLPASAQVKCLSDAGFFINAKDINGAEYIKSYFNEVVTTHGSTKNLPSYCISRLSPGMCFFPQYFARDIQTPLFILNAAYDSWQIRNILAPGFADPLGVWQNCKLDIKQCSSSQLHMIQGFRTQFLHALAEIGNSSSTGLFINSCHSHCQSEMQVTWFRYDSPMLGNKTIADSVGDWFYGRGPFQKIGCPYPRDKCRQNIAFEANSGFLLL